MMTWKISQGNVWLQNWFRISCAIPGAEKEQKVEVTSWSQIILYGEMCVMSVRHLFVRFDLDACLSGYSRID